jgi:hypothetical protein
MRITKQQLQQVIDEEVSNALLRIENRRLLEASSGPMSSLYGIDANELLDFADAYASLGSDAQSQLRDVVQNLEAADVDLTSMRSIERIMGGRNNGIDASIEAWRSHNT